MGTDRSNSASGRSALFAWLVRVNNQVSQWASSMSWWRLIVLFLVILVAGSIIEDLLRLKHDRVRVASTGKETVVTIGGPQGIRIVKGGRLAPKSEAGTAVQPPGGAASSPGAGAGAARGPNNDVDVDPQDVEEALVGRQVMTLRGLLGDLGGVVMVILFAYLVAAKIVVKKVAQADAKVRTRSTRPNARSWSVNWSRPACKCCRPRSSPISCSTPWAPSTF